MAALRIPNIPERLDRLALALRQRIQKADRVVFLGDWFDAFGPVDLRRVGQVCGFLNGNINGLRWEDGDIGSRLIPTEFLLGNHDCHYFFSHNGFKCSGYDPRKQEVIEANVPQGIIDIVPSAELSSAQNVDEGKGDPIFYPYHDRLLAMWLEGRMDPTAIMRWTLAGTLERELGCADGIVAKYFRTRAAFVKNLEWAWRQYSYEGKRHMLPPGLIRTRAFGFDRRETIADAYFTREYKTLRDEYLRQTP